MLICPKCKAEYREGFEVCNDCSIKLVSQNQTIKEKIQDNLDYENLLFLVNVADGYEVNIIESLFESNDITFFKKHREAGEYLKIRMGMTSYGIDIYVKKSQIIKAKEILEDIKVNEIENKLSKEEVLDEKIYNKKRRLRVWLMLGLGFIPGIIFLVFNLLSKIYYLIVR